MSTLTLSPGPWKSNLLKISLYLQMCEDILKSIDKCRDWSDDKVVGILYSSRYLRRGTRIRFFLFLHKTNMLWYSLEAPRRGASNAYYNIILWRNKKKYQYILLKKASYLFYIQYEVRPADKTKLSLNVGIFTALLGSL